MANTMATMQGCCCVPPIETVECPWFVDGVAPRYCVLNVPGLTDGPVCDHGGCSGQGGGSYELDWVGLEGLPEHPVANTCVWELPLSGSAICVDDIVEVTREKAMVVAYYNPGVGLYEVRGFICADPQTDGHVWAAPFRQAGLFSIGNTYTLSTAGTTGACLQSAFGSVEF